MLQLPSPQKRRPVPQPTRLKLQFPSGPCSLTLVPDLLPDESAPAMFPTLPSKVNWQCLAPAPRSPPPTDRLVRHQATPCAIRRQGRKSIICRPRVRFRCQQAQSFFARPKTVLTIKLEKVVGKQGRHAARSRPHPGVQAATLQESAQMICECFVARINSAMSSLSDSTSSMDGSLPQTGGFR